MSFTKPSILFVDRNAQPLHGTEQLRPERIPRLNEIISFNLPSLKGRYLVAFVEHVMSVDLSGTNQQTLIYLTPYKGM